MKKIFSLLFLGILSLSLFSPIQVIASEEHSNTETSSSLYSQSVGIAPLASPYQTQVTLNNGESYEISMKYAYLADSAHPPFTQIIAESQEEEVSYLETSLVGSNDPKYTDKIICEDTYNVSQILLPNSPGNYYFPEVNYKITNYSPGRVTYNLTIRFGMIQPS